VTLLSCKEAVSAGTGPCLVGLREDSACQLKVSVVFLNHYKKHSYDMLNNFSVEYHFVFQNLLEYLNTFHEALYFFFSWEDITDSDKTLFFFLLLIDLNTLMRSATKRILFSFMKFKEIQQLYCRFCAAYSQAKRSREMFLYGSDFEMFVA